MLYRDTKQDCAIRYIKRESPPRRQAGRAFPAPSISRGAAGAQQYLPQESKRTNETRQQKEAADMKISTESLKRYKWELLAGANIIALVALMLGKTFL